TPPTGERRTIVLVPDLKATLDRGSVFAQYVACRISADIASDQGDLPQMHIVAPALGACSRGRTLIMEWCAGAV
ncbi:MAG: hypothetical protein V2B18_04295, partial [Pseudomonadota bacterium]